MSNLPDRTTLQPDPSISDSPTITTAEKANQFLNDLEKVAATLLWICDSIKFQLLFGDGDFNKFQFIVSKSLLEAAEVHVAIISGLRIISGATIMDVCQEEKFAKLMGEVVVFEEDILVPEAALKARVHSHAAMFPLA